MCTGTCEVDDLEVGRAADDAGIAVDRVCGAVDDDVAVNDGLSKCAGFSRSRKMVCR